jgi:CheY-like chemotaxis protein
MTESALPQGSSRSIASEATMPDAFLIQVRDLLAHLYDLAYIQELAIATERATVQHRPRRMIASALKQEVIECLEALNPGRDFYFRAPESRAYNILLIHYVERHTVQKAADELGISERQAYRDLRQAEADLARLLWRRQCEIVLASAVHESLAQHGQTESMELVDLHELLASAAGVVYPLAETASIEIGLAPPSRPIALLTNLPMARQVLIIMLSRAIQSAMDRVAIAVTDDEVNVRIEILFALRMNTSNYREQSEIVLQSMLEKLGWRLDWATTGVTLHLSNPAPQNVILCIDDDAGFSELLRRYLTGFPVAVFSASNGQEGIEQVLQIIPDLVILDVMMAGIDGWETLQRIRTHVATQHIPVVVCSVFDDPELAYSLGATAMLSKPLASTKLLRVLEELEII